LIDFSDKMWEKYQDSFSDLQKSDFLRYIKDHLYENNPMIVGKSKVKNLDIFIDYNHNNKGKNEA